jgi:hypothetical protein
MQLDSIRGRRIEQQGQLTCERWSSGGAGPTGRIMRVWASLGRVHLKALCGDAVGDLFVHLILALRGCATARRSRHGLGRYPESGGARAARCQPRHARRAQSRQCSPTDGPACRTLDSICSTSLPQRRDLGPQGSICSYRSRARRWAARDTAIGRPCPRATLATPKAGANRPFAPLAAMLTCCSGAPIAPRCGVGV